MKKADVVNPGPQVMKEGADKSTELWRPWKHS